MGPYVGVDYNLTFCPLQNRLQHTNRGQPYVRVDLNPMPDSTLSVNQGLGFGLWCQIKSKTTGNIKQCLLCVGTRHKERR